MFSSLNEIEIDCTGLCLSRTLIVSAQASTQFEKNSNDSKPELVTLEGVQMIDSCLEDLVGEMKPASTSIYKHLFFC